MVLVEVCDAALRDYGSDVRAERHDFRHLLSTRGARAVAFAASPQLGGAHFGHARVLTVEENVTRVCLGVKFLVAHAALLGAPRVLALAPLALKLRPQPIDLRVLPGHRALVTHAQKHHVQDER